MFIIQLRFSTNKVAARQFMDGHNQWIQRGVDDGVFALVGSLVPNLGGVLIARGSSLAEMQERVAEDPFVAHDVVSAEILEVAPSRFDDRLAFLVEGGT